MRARCLNPHHAKYANYGGRGITICARWDSFGAFIADMGARPYGYTLDRLDSNGIYEPDNCRWADASTQNKNRRPMAHCPCGYFARHRTECQGRRDDELAA